MTIVNLFRRYRRWNPVHPTFGAFWGVGVGLGCGVGWGPGFGPEAVGFVGSGCGVGFSVGVTLIGSGVGLPASGLTCLPYNAVLWTGKETSNITVNFAIPALAFGVKQSWEALAFQSAALGKGVQRFCEIEVSKGIKFVNQLQVRVLRGLQEKPEPPSTEASSKSQYPSQTVQFSRAKNWIKEPPFKSSRSASLSTNPEVRSESAEEDSARKI